MPEHHQVLKNCGNFSIEVLPGMVAYSQEKDVERRGRVEASDFLPESDGYASKEGDLVLGGFLQSQAAVRASTRGQRLADMDLKERQKLALELSLEHIEEHGGAGLEYYKHWLKRVESYAKHHSIALPAKAHENDFEYSRRLRRWCNERKENWPDPREAVGTHLMLSPDPKTWSAIRESGGDERTFLHAVLSKTMKDMADWRRKIHGHGRSLGWMAGSHVQASGADRHPHIHLVVLKRDADGKEVDWSGSSIKGRKGRETEPDPLKEIKRLFKKNVEKEYQKVKDREAETAFFMQKNTGKRSGEKAETKDASEAFSQAPHEKKVDPDTGKDPYPTPVRLKNAIQRFRVKDRHFRLMRGLRSLSNIMRPYYPRGVAGQVMSEIGAMIRIGRAIQNGASQLPDLSFFRAKMTQQFNTKTQIER